MIKLFLCNGIHDLQSLPDTPDITWTTSTRQDKFITNKGCQTIHFNLWRQPPNSVTPSGNQEVIIKKFQHEFTL
ncbi:MAG: hypothetical protein HRT68_04625 [Flavobacteriaceae bacterium]|nr:hypothetical protein [Flavobacteriaceae bacterium]